MDMNSGLGGCKKIRKTTQCYAHRSTSRRIRMPLQPAAHRDRAGREPLGAQGRDAFRPHPHAATVQGPNARMGRARASGNLRDAA